jgi:hypothetical protein
VISGERRDAMPLPVEIKLDDNRAPVLDEGLPVYKFDDGSESPLDVVGAFENFETKIGNLTDEKDRHFNAKDKLKKDLKAFDGIDLESAKANAEIVTNLKDKEILDEQGIKALKVEMRSSFDLELDQVKTEFKTEKTEWDKKEIGLNDIIYDLAVTNKFATSPFFSGEKPKTIYPAEDAVKIFGKHFEVKIQDDKLDIIAKDDLGKPILSKKRHGEQATFEEAVEQLVGIHSKKFHILNSGRSGGPPAHGNLNDPDGGQEPKTSLGKIKAGLNRHYAREGR